MIKDLNVRVLYFFLHYSGSKGNCLPAGEIALTLPHASFWRTCSIEKSGEMVAPVFLCGSKRLHARSFLKAFSMWYIRTLSSPRCYPLKNWGWKWVNFFSQDGSRLWLQHLLWQHLRRGDSFSLYIPIVQEADTDSHCFCLVPDLIPRWMKAIASNRFCLLSIPSLIYPAHYWQVMSLRILLFVSQINSKLLTLAFKVSGIVASAYLFHIHLPWLCWHTQSAPALLFLTAP